LAREEQSKGVIDYHILLCIRRRGKNVMYIMCKCCRDLLMC